LLLSESTILKTLIIFWSFIVLVANLTGLLNEKFADLISFWITFTDLLNKKKVGKLVPVSIVRMETSVGSKEEETEKSTLLVVLNPTPLGVETLVFSGIVKV